MIWPSSSCAFDLHLQSTVMISIILIYINVSSHGRLANYCSCNYCYRIAIKSSNYLALAYYATKRQPQSFFQLPITSTKHDHLIQQLISHHVLTISHHNMPCQNKLDVLYFVVASFTWLLRASSKNRSYLRIKTTTIVRQVGAVLTFSRTGRSHTRFN